MKELHEDTPTIDDVGQLPENKDVKDLKNIHINRHDNDKYFMIGTSLPKIEEKLLIRLLTQYMKVFAWTPYDMPGIDLEVACHKLNVDPQHRPVVQKGRRTAT